MFLRECMCLCMTVQLCLCARRHTHANSGGRQGQACFLNHFAHALPLHDLCVLCVLENATVGNRFPWKTRSGRSAHGRVGSPWTAVYVRSGCLIRSDGGRLGDSSLSPFFTRRSSPRAISKLHRIVAHMQRNTLSP